MKIGFGVCSTTTEASPALRDEAAKENIVGRGTYDKGLGEPIFKTAKLECPICRTPLREIVNAHLLKAGRVVAFDAGRIAIDLLPPDMHAFRCAECEVVFYSPHE